MNAALLLSGGAGTRIGSDVPKQYIRVKDKMLITYSLETLVRSPDIDEIQIVAEERWRQSIMGDAGRFGIPVSKIKGFAKPGHNRQTSILNGMQNILRRRRTAAGHIGERDSLLVHDAARPLLTAKQIRDCYANLSGHDGVMPALPMKDTVYFSQNGSGVSELIDRNRVFAGQAPELFDFEKYYQANMALLPDRISLINGATEPAVMAGMDIVMIAGDENNFKITTQADLDRFCSMIGGKEWIL